LGLREALGFYFFFIKKLAASEATPKGEGLAAQGTALSFKF